MSEYLGTRAQFGDIRVGDPISTYQDRNAPSWTGANGHSWMGTVKAVRRSGEYVQVDVTVHSRSLCADDLVYGFGGTRDGLGREVVMTLNRKPTDYLLQRVRDRRTGRRYWSGVVAGAVA